MKGSNCINCKHFFGGNTCAAFDEIPEAISSGDVLHIEPYEGDKGIQFEKLEEPGLLQDNLGGED